MIDILSMEFMQNALMAGFLVSIGAGIIGSLIVLNRMVFIAGGIAHGAYGGIGIAFFFGFLPLLGATLFALFLSAIIAFITYKNRERIDSVIGAMWAAGMATGIILTDLTPGYNADLMSYLFGSILSVPAFDLLIMFAYDALIATIVFVYYKDLLAMSYDSEFASLRGVPVKVLYFLLIAMIAISVVITIRAVGLILVIALLTIPSYIAEKITSSLDRMMIVSSFLAFLFVLLGLWISFVFDISSGASIILTGSIAFFLFLAGRRLKVI